MRGSYLHLIGIIVPLGINNNCKFRRILITLIIIWPVGPGVCFHCKTIDKIPVWGPYALAWAVAVCPLKRVWLICMVIANLTRIRSNFTDNKWYVNLMIRPSIVQETSKFWKSRATKNLSGWLKNYCSWPDEPHSWI